MIFCFFSLFTSIGSKAKNTIHHINTYIIREPVKLNYILTKLIFVKGFFPVLSLIVLLIMNCFFSIITVAFNSEKTIEDNIISVRNQKFKNYEHIIIDNLSSDSTKELVRQQNELLKGLKDITPALHEAMGAIGKIDMNILKNIF